MIFHICRIINQLILGRIKQHPPHPSETLVPFRCWPVDIDMYMHMNNAAYFRVAEYARWRIIYSAGMLSKPEFKGLFFIVVDQNAVYKKPILPFRKYVVAISISTTDDKWLQYTHRFLQDPSTVKPGQQPIEYAVVNTKAVLKEPSGKTFKPSDVKKYSPWANEFFQDKP